MSPLIYTHPVRILTQRGSLAIQFSSFILVWLEPCRNSTDTTLVKLKGYIIIWYLLLQLQISQLECHYFFKKKRNPTNECPPRLNTYIGLFFSRQYIFIYIIQVYIYIYSHGRRMFFIRVWAWVNSKPCGGMYRPTSLPSMERNGMFDPRARLLIIIGFLFAI